LGSVIRTDQTVVAREIFASKSEGRGKVGRPKLDGCKMERMIYER
jgi:predicted RNA-binding protein